MLRHELMGRQIPLTEPKRLVKIGQDHGAIINGYIALSFVGSRAWKCMLHNFGVASIKMADFVFGKERNIYEGVSVVPRCLESRYIVVSTHNCHLTTVYKAL